MLSLGLASFTEHSVFLGSPSHGMDQYIVPLYCLWHSIVWVTAECITYSLGDNTWVTGVSFRAVIL